ncbi:uncharacterized protein BXZ73DRAFT_86508 [Epithele typhae]|uniref:uncharacterized protein n=1 Tax=Epithele typhae TaxID=378194 RepID=UPI00200770C1|nr:uncharacterized protein BXZ73DRAFT_86508 [Epithele typhae]KAH9946371.1 hypothetical protein BXZ73DRAFT_86508 [Epithele typhae]
MPTLSSFTLPLDAVPPGFDPGTEALTDGSNTAAFDTGLDRRDVFLGVRRCVVCGTTISLQHARIIPRIEADTWMELNEHQWLPENAKRSVKHEARNGITLCATHHVSFDRHDFFIRFFPGPDGDMRGARFVFVNYAEKIDYEPFHYKAIALDPADRYSPIPALFIIHESRVRGRHPFHNPTPDCPGDTIEWAAWILPVARCVPTVDWQAISTATSPMASPPSGGVSESSTSRPLPHINDALADILAAQRKMPTWRACVAENTSWDGTADENVQKYVATVGLEGSDAQ